MYIGIDIGGTNARVASSKSVDNPKIISRLEFRNTHDFKEDFSNLVKAIKMLSPGVEGIGVGFPGYLNRSKTEVFRTNHRKEWMRKPFVKNMSQEFGCEVFMDNDAVASSLGVSYYEEKNDKEFIYITWGTGIGGARVEKTNSDTKGAKLNWNKYFESWEEKCGGKKLELNYGKSGDKLSEKDWEKIMKDFLEELRVFNQKVKSELIVFGGGVSTKQRSRILNLDTKKYNLPSIHVSKLGEDAGLYGAFGLIKSRLSVDKLTTQ